MNYIIFSFLKTFSGINYFVSALQARTIQGRLSIYYQNFLWRNIWLEIKKSNECALRRKELIVLFIITMLKLWSLQNKWTTTLKEKFQGFASICVIFTQKVSYINKRKCLSWSKNRYSVKLFMVPLFWFDLLAKYFFLCLINAHTKQTSIHPVL